MGYCYDYRARAADDKQLLHPLEWQTFKKEYPCISTGA